MKKKIKKPLKRWVAATRKSNPIITRPLENELEWLLHKRVKLLFYFGKGSWIRCQLFGNLEKIPSEPNVYVVVQKPENNQNTQFSFKLSDVSFIDHDIRTDSVIGIGSESFERYYT